MKELKAAFFNINHSIVVECSNTSYSMYANLLLDRFIVIQYRTVTEIVITSSSKIKQHTVEVCYQQILSSLSANTALPVH